MKRVLFAIAALVAAALLGASARAAEPVAAGVDPGAPAELARIYAQILRDPTNSQLNLRYAELAEASGKLRWALAAYERVASAAHSAITIPSSRRSADFMPTPSASSRSASPPRTC